MDAEIDLKSVEVNLSTEGVWTIPPGEKLVTYLYSNLWSNFSTGLTAIKRFWSVSYTVAW